MRVLLCSLLSVLVLASCKKASEPAPGPAKPAPAKETPKAPTAEKPTPPLAGHGDATRIGVLEVAGFRFELTALGTIAPGAEAAVTAKTTGGATPDAWRSLDVYATFEAADGSPVSRPGKAIIEGGVLHMHTTVTPGAAAPAALSLRVRHEGLDERKSIPLPTGLVGAAGTASANTGVFGKLQMADGTHLGHAEVKLHDDKGDIEVWLTKPGAEPLDLPKATTLSLVFQSHDNKALTLAARDHATNPDEDGHANMRDGMTNYFIFPGTSGADASWLKGGAFTATIVLSFTQNGQAVTTPAFTLKPHSHAGADSHHGPAGQTH